ncbi:MAG: SDR family oxidoreductase [Caldilineaceae bacterium]|nr:SDR family oxidoreductase [Caldilineaceae bacterium]
MEGKAAIVTGAGSRGRAALGIGYATAVLFARQGARVVVADLDEDRAEATIKFIKEHGGEASFISADITREEDCRALAGACVDRYGSLDILVNNAGGVGGGRVTDYEPALWNVALDVNLKGPVMACKYAVPHMAAGGGGSIIHISSIDGLLAGAYINVPYSVAKGGLATLTRLMAVHHGREGIRVNCLAPGHVHASFTAEFSMEERERRRKIGPLGTEGTAWDVAYAALYFASDEARWISGIVMPVDGGLLAATPLAVMGNLAE